MAVKALVVANWKMNPPTWRDAKKLFDATKRTAEKVRGVSLVLAVPSVYLRGLHASAKGRRIALAAQNCSADPSGAHTGELSLSQIKDAGAEYVLIGHSERRAMGEDDEDVRKKTAAALAAKLTPIVCVGEKQRFQSGEHFDIVRKQLVAAFADVEPAQFGKVIVAYEPVWAIGGEEAMKPRDIHEMAILIRKSLVARFGDKAMSQKIIYGGATNESNARAILREGDVSGLLPGHVSLDPARFSSLLISITARA